MDEVQPSLPLDGITVLVTRAENQAARLSQMLADAGASPIELPVLQIKEPSSWQPLDTAIGTISQYDWIVFASGNAVTAFFERAETLGLSTSDLQARIAAIGAVTKDRLAQIGMKTDFHPSAFVAEQFVAEFSTAFKIADKRILFPRTNTGRTLIADDLNALGARVDMVETYTTGLPDRAEELSAKLARLVVNRQLDVITLGSSQTARNFNELLRAGLCAHLDVAPDTANSFVASCLESVLLATIGPITSQTTLQIFGRVDIEAREFSAKGLVASLTDYYSKSSAPDAKRS